MPSVLTRSRHMSAAMLIQSITNKPILNVEYVEFYSLMPPLKTYGRAGGKHRIVLDKHNVNVRCYYAHCHRTETKVLQVHSYTQAIKLTVDN